MFTYKTVRSSRKTIGIYLSSDGQHIEVRAPRRLSAAEIRAFVESKTDWINKKQAELRARPPKLVDFLPGEQYFYLGKLYPLVLSDRRGPTLVFDGMCFSLSKYALPRAREVFTNWYRQQARSLLTARTAALAALYDLAYAKIRISSARTRWGSCGHNATLSFSWRLIMAPPDSIDYVIVHELAHLVHKNHSSRFWAQVAAMQPDYARRKIWLKEHGPQIAEL